MKPSSPSKSLVIIRIKLIFVAFFLVVYATFLLRPSSSVYRHHAARVSSCSSSRGCMSAQDGFERHIKTKANLEEPRNNLARGDKPNFMSEMGRGMKIGMVNMEGEDLSDEWYMHGQIIPITFNKVSELLEWKDLFPEWIDEEEEADGPSCPEIPMPRFESYEYLDMIVAKLPCKWPKEGWRRDVFRLQVHLIAANLAAKRGKRDWINKTKVVFLSKCMPLLELFRCDDLVKREADWWFYEPEMARLEDKVSLPVGSCNLALPLWGKGINVVYDASKIKPNTKSIKRQAYLSVLHSSETYICGAIALAQSLLQTGTKRDLILLVDNSISVSKRHALASAGWKIRPINRIRNPRAQRKSYNEYNYTKLRLWQLTDYDKIIFIDSDIIVLRNIDILFHFPQLSATGNDGSVFNSGIMVIEPSNCTFRIFMQRTKDIVSYNGGDQGFLNEVFVWWHRLPRRINLLKNFWSNTTTEASFKNQLFGSDPPKLYAIHYLGLKPWLCYRDYDCNWDVGNQRVYASDVAHRRWWKLHDSMEEGLKKFCGLSGKRKFNLEWNRKMAQKMGFQDEHWKILVTDLRRLT